MRRPTASRRTSVPPGGMLIAILRHAAVYCFHCKGRARIMDHSNGGRRRMGHRRRQILKG